MNRKGILSALRTVDGICKLTTGKKLSQVIAQGVEVFGQDVWKKVENHAVPPDPLQAEYDLLMVHPDSPDFLVKGAFRYWTRETHPDTAKTPDSKKYQAITEAYNKIMAARSKAKDGESHS